MALALILATLVSLGIPSDQRRPILAPVAPAASIPAPVVPDESCTTLPSPPRAVEARILVPEVLVSWSAPRTSGCTPLTGYVVIRSPGEPVVVDASTTSVTLPWHPDLRVAVAAMNEVGCSLSTRPIAPNTPPKWVLRR